MSEANDLFSDQIVAPDDPRAGDWPEDMAHENGNYACYCLQCGRTFGGYKRRQLCKVCAMENERRAQGPVAAIVGASHDGATAMPARITDIEIRQLCARAVGVPFMDGYDPLTKDRQADALRKLFALKIDRVSGATYKDRFRATLRFGMPLHVGSEKTVEIERYAIAETRNRAIATVVANHMWGRGAP